MDEIQSATGTTLLLSDVGKHFPGTSLMELNIQGVTQQTVLGAAVHVLAQISETNGTVMNDGGALPAGSARVRCVIPAKATASIIGPRGEAVKQLKQQTGIQ